MIRQDDYSAPKTKTAQTTEARLRRAQERAARAKAALERAEHKAAVLARKAADHQARQARRDRTTYLVAMGLIFVQYLGNLQNAATKDNWIRYISDSNAISAQQRALILQKIGV